MFSTRWQLFRLRGIPIRVDASWLLIAALLTWTIAERFRLAAPDQPAGVYWSLEHQFPSQVVYRPALINGEPGLLRYVGGKIESAQSFIVEEGRIVAVFIMRNPDKLTAVPQFI